MSGSELSANHDCLGQSDGQLDVLSTDGLWEENARKKHDVLEMFGPPSPDETRASEETVDQDEMVPWEYARYHGLCQNYQSIEPRISLCSLPLFEPVQDNLDLAREQVVSILSEKLTIDEPTVAILKSAICDVPEQTFRPPGPNRRLGKLELPFLKSDHEMDMNRFARQSQPDLSSLILPFEPVDQECNEGFDWHPSMLELPKTVENDIWKEKFQVPKETLLYMKDILDKGEPELFLLEDKSPDALSKVCRLSLWFTARTNYSHSMFH
jgi:hypothetical protein